jgi:ABC-type uncharacterized transport system permease subunit
MNFTILLVVNLAIAIGSLVIAYFVIRAAVLSALREHTRSSVTAVSLVTSNFHKADKPAG